MQHNTRILFLVIQQLITLYYHKRNCLTTSYIHFGIDNIPTLNKMSTKIHLQKNYIILKILLISNHLPSGIHPHPQLQNSNRWRRYNKKSFLILSRSQIKRIQTKLKNNNKMTTHEIKAFIIIGPSFITYIAFGILILNLVSSKDRNTPIRSLKCIPNKA